MHKATIKYFFINFIIYRIKFRCIYNQRVGKSSSLRTTLEVFFPLKVLSLLLTSFGSYSLGFWTALVPKPKSSELAISISTLVLLCKRTFYFTTSFLFLSSLVSMRVSFYFFNHSALTYPLTGVFF